MRTNKRKAIRKEDRIKIWSKFDKKCAYCGEKLNYKDMQVDHVKALHNGGKDTMANYYPACRPCNFYKSTLSIEGFRERLQTLIDRLTKIFIVRLAIKYKILKVRKWDSKFHFEKFKK